LRRGLREWWLTVGITPSLAGYTRTQAVGSEGKVSMRNRWLFLTGLAALAARPALGQQATEQAGWRLAISSVIYEELGRIADTSRVETVRCLIGVMNGDTAKVDLAYQPRILESSTTDVQYMACPLATLALWHNHPRTNEKQPEDVCYLSTDDIRQALAPGAPLLQVVTVNSEVTCIWHRSQIESHRGERMLWPEDGVTGGGLDESRPDDSQNQTGKLGSRSRTETD